MVASIIIPIYRRTNWIIKCIESLQKQDYKGEFEIIVADDGSPNELEVKASLEKFAGMDYASIKYIRNKHAGPAATRNYGVKHSKGKLLCFIDDDSIPEKTWLSEMANSFNKGKNTAIVSGLILSYDRVNKLPLLLEKAAYSGKHWATCNICYRRDVFEALGGFDETFPESSWEDNDLGIRARWAGYAHVYNKQAIVYHNHEESIDEYKKKCLLNGRGAAVFSRKYIFKKPLWGIGTPFVMSRRLIYGLYPSVWLRKTDSVAYLRFLWSYFSLQGFLKNFFRKRLGKD
ncbi:MAG: glycosyltransferase [Nitrospirota bacterium]